MECKIKMKDRWYFSKSKKPNDLRFKYSKFILWRWIFWKEVNPYRYEWRY